jgi:hypothetical protein
MFTNKVLDGGLHYYTNRVVVSEGGGVWEFQAGFNFNMCVGSLQIAKLLLAQKEPATLSFSHSNVKLKDNSRRVSRAIDT